MNKKITTVLIIYFVSLFGIYYFILTCNESIESVVVFNILFLFYIEYLILKSKINNLIKILLLLLFILLPLSPGLIMVSGPCSAASDTAKDSRIEATMNEIRFVAAIYYAENNTFLNFTKEKDALLLKEDIETDSKKELTIYTSKDKYCLQVILLEKERINWFKQKIVYYCVDNNGYVYKGSKDSCDNLNFSCQQ